MRTAIYTRVSTEDQVQGYSLESQTRILRELCKDRGWTVEMETVDDITGSTLERPGLSAAREAVRDKRVDCLLVYDPDRLSRKLAHLMILQDECERHNVRLEFASQPAAKTSEDRLLLNVRGVIAEYEREKIRERTMRGRDTKARRGLIVGGIAPYGYVYGEPGKLAIDMQAAPVVREMYERASKGESIRSITRWLNGSEAQPKRGGESWQKSSVQRILSSETYCGQVWYFRRKRIVGCGVRQMREKSAWIPLTAPPIITRELFSAVASRLQCNRTALAGRPSATYLLRGLLVCADCGKRLGGQKCHGARSYRCNGRCPKSQQTDADKMERTIWRAVTATFGNPAELRRIVSAKLAELRDRWGGPSSAKLDQRIALLRKREERSVKLLMDASLADHEAMLRGEISTCRKQREDAERQRAAIASRADVMSSVSAICEAIPAAIRRADCDDATKRILLVKLVREVKVSGKKLAICSELSTPLARCGQFEVVINTEVA